jgi:hypothetical protein
MPGWRTAFRLAATAAIGGALVVGWLSWPDATAGPCAVAGGPFTVPELGEASGLAIGRRSPGVLWLHNDSQNDAVLFAIDTAGAVRGRVRVPLELRDWEDVSAAKCPAGNCLFIADIGDNGLERRQVQVLRVPEPSVTDTQTATPDRFAVVYPDGPHNAEALFVVEDDVFIVTKDGTGLLFRGRMPAAGGGVVEMHRVGELDMQIVSDAETSPDGRVVVVRNPRAAAFYLTADLVAGRAVPYARISLEGLGELQGEGVSFDGTMLYLSSEGRPWTSGGSLLILRCTITASEQPSPTLRESSTNPGRSNHDWPSRRRLDEGHLG